MHILRKIALMVATSLLPIFLFSFGLSFSLYQVFGTPDHIQSALKQSGVYETFISDVLAKAKTGDGQSDNIPVDRPEIKNIIQNAASPAFLQQQTEGFLSSMYAWIKGDSKQLNLEINLTEAKAKLTDGLTTYANERLATLPVCPGQLPSESFDALNAECIPKGVDRAAAVEKVRQEIAGGDFLKDPLITQNDIKDDQGKTLEQQLNAVPGVYSQLVTVIWLSGVLALVLSAAIVVLHVPWRAGLRRIGIVFISVGGVSALLAWGSGFLTQKLADSLAQSSEGEIQASLAKIVSILTNDLRTWWLTYGLTILILGIGILVALKFIKAKPDDGETSRLTEKSENKNKPQGEPPTTKVAPQKPTNQ